MRTRTAMAMAMGLAASLAGCGAPDEAPSIGAAAAALTAANGLSPNGLARNGLARNGLARNGLLTAEFQGWFDEDPATADAVMTYVARCAVPAGRALSYTSPTSGATFTWSGSLGLAPGWSSGLEATVAEEQVISACLAAHVNKYGRAVEISILGQGATGVPIPIGKKELSTFSQPEGCFFGNLFEDEGVSVGLDHEIWGPDASSARACAFDIFGIGPSADCPPIDNVGLCTFACTADPTGTFYTSCGRFVNWTWKSYLPITTRVRPADVYTCGDGTCQFTESCGTGSSYDSCQADCGACPGTGIDAPITTTATKTTGKTSTTWWRR